MYVLLLRMCGENAGFGTPPHQKNYNNHVIDNSSIKFHDNDSNLLGYTMAISRFIPGK